MTAVAAIGAATGAVEVMTGTGVAVGTTGVVGATREAAAGMIVGETGGTPPMAEITAMTGIALGIVAAKLFGPPKETADEGSGLLLLARSPSA